MRKASTDTPEQGSPRTHFAPAGRAEPSVLEAEIQACLESPVARVVLESLDGLVMVLNQQRQILAANAALLEGLEGGEDIRDAPPIGRRPGEVLECIHVQEGPDGCGTSKSCGRCGAALAILAAQAGDRGTAAGECLLSMRRQGQWQAAEFQVQARALDLAGHPCVVLVLHDISARKRKESLESLFFHDVINLLQGLKGWGESLQEGASDPRRAATQIVSLSERITHEVLQQRIILLAEHGQLEVRLRPTPPAGILEDLDGACRLHGASAGRSFLIDPVDGISSLRTDPDLLMRVLVNMGVNALEAVPQGGCVRAGLRLEAGSPTFYVWNEGVIPDAIGLSIFQRSFSTKGAKGRGLGTYAMKLIGENHLKGRVGFRSTNEEGTTFFIQLPPEALGLGS